MLVLSRKINESIMVGNDIEIVIIDIRHDKVRIGITAPRALPVHRLEVFDAINRGERKPMPSVNDQLRQIAAEEIIVNANGELL